ncbi:hypothetical protein HU002_05625 [Staphylococcus sp. SS251]|nr:hypothetical protein [Staphylococcus singaporensis]MBE5678193.1 hypothetical protein [Staphylococcus singaporensis]
MSVNYFEGIVFCEIIYRKLRFISLYIFYML